MISAEAFFMIMPPAAEVFDSATSASPRRRPRQSGFRLIDVAQRRGAYSRRWLGVVIGTRRLAGLRAGENRRRRRHACPSGVE